MTILHTQGDSQFTAHLRSILAEANGTPHSVDIAVGYFYLSGFTPSRRPAGVETRKKITRKDAGKRQLSREYSNDT